jgi:hypothetical protein
MWDASATARRADGQRGELIDCIAAGAPVRKLRFIEALGHTRVPLAGFRPDYRAGIVLGLCELATIDAQRAAEAAADIKRRLMMVLRARRGGTGSKYVTFRGGLRRAIPYPPRWSGAAILNSMWDETVLPAFASCVEGRIFHTFEDIRDWQALCGVSSLRETPDYHVEKPAEKCAGRRGNTRAKLPVTSLVAVTSFLNRRRFSEMVRPAIFIFALTTQAKAAEPPLWVLIGLDGHMGPTITYRDTARDADIHVTKVFRPSRPQQLARQPYATRLRNMRVSHMQRETTAVFCASIIRPWSKVNETTVQKVP